jgi:hypothetical protein
MNTEMAGKVLEHIQAHPEKHDQGRFVSECGTTMCIAGWTCNLAGYKTTYVYGMPVVDIEPGGFTLFELLAAELLGIETKEGIKALFCVMDKDKAVRRLKELANGNPDWAAAR